MTRGKKKTQKTHQNKETMFGMMQNKLLEKGKNTEPGVGGSRIKDPERWGRQMISVNE